MLALLKKNRSEPKQLISLIFSFYTADEVILNMADDSSGDIGYVFNDAAKEIFLQYAVSYPEKEWLSQEVFELSLNDDYGVRAALVNCANQYLPVPVLRKLVALYWKEQKQDIKEVRKNLCLYSIKSIAKQLNDANLYEDASLVIMPEPSSGICFDIARVHYESGGTESALLWLLKIGDDDRYMRSERMQLLLKVYSKLNRKDEQEQIAWDIFQNSRDLNHLKCLLNIVGEEKKDNIIRKEVENIKNNKKSITQIFLF